MQAIVFIDEEVQGRKSDCGSVDELKAKVLNVLDERVYHVLICKTRETTKGEMHTGGHCDSKQLQLPEELIMANRKYRLTDIWHRIRKAKYSCMSCCMVL